MNNLFETIAKATKPRNIPVITSRFGSYNKIVMNRAWQDYKTKKAHKGYEKCAFADSLRRAHRTIKLLRKNIY